MKVVKDFLILMLISMSFSCGSQVYGVYSFNSKYTHDIYHTIELNCDNKYYSTQREGISLLVDSGIWKIKEDNIILNSFSDDNVCSSEVIETYNNNFSNDSLYILLVNCQEEGVFNVECNIKYYDDSEKILYTDLDGKCVIKKYNVEKVEVNFMGKNFNSQIESNSQINELKIIIDDNESILKRFNNDTVALKGENIVLKDYSLKLKVKNRCVVSKTTIL